MANQSYMRSVVNGLLPDGSIWHPAPGGNFDNLLAGVGDNWQQPFDYLSQLATLRNPSSTIMLADLERDFGIVPNSTLTDSQRRLALAARKIRSKRLGSVQDIQAALDAAGLGNGGYGLHAYANDPPIDPALFTSALAICYVGQSNAVCGNQTAYCGISGGFIIAGQDQRAIISPAYYGIGMSVMCCGNNYADCGYFQIYNYGTSKAPTPVHQSAWPLVIFIAASATITSSGISAVQFGSLPAVLRSTLYDVLLRVKPLHCWIAALISFT